MPKQILNGFAAVLTVSLHIATVSNGVSNCGPESGAQLEFAAEALSLPALSGEPILASDRRLKDFLSADLGEAVRRTGEAGRTLPYREISRTGSISAGFALGKIEEWRHRTSAVPDSVGDETSVRDLDAAKGAVTRATGELLAMSELGAMAPQAVPLLEQGVERWSWFRTEVDSPYRYILGDKTALAVDLVLFLKSLQETGEARDGMGRLVARLRGARRHAVPNLVAEYVLHETLEQTELSHDQIIEITTKLFGYGIFRPALEFLSREVSSGVKIFTRPGQTPLGRALRAFIESRFEDFIVRFRGAWLHMSVFDPAFRSVVFLEGVLKYDMGTAGPPGAAVVIEGTHGGTALHWSRILRIVPLGLGPLAGTFSDTVQISLQMVEQQLHAGSHVTLTEPQVRAIASLENPASWLNDLFLAVCQVRDGEGVRIRQGMRPDTKWVAFMETCAHALSGYLGDLGVALYVDHELVLNDPMYPPFSFGLASVFPLADGEERLMDDAQRISNAFLGYRYLTLYPLTTDEDQTGSPKTSRIWSRLSAST